jgi:hypothetical protein
VDETRQPIAARYGRFALEARGRSPLYERAAAAIAADPLVLDMLAGTWIDWR